MVKKKEEVDKGSKSSNPDVKEPEAVISSDVDLKKLPLISLKGVSKSFGKKLVLKDAEFEICEGDIFGLIGMSGSGKTTLFQLIAGLISPTSGDVLVRRDLLGIKKDKKSKKTKESPDYFSVFRNQKAIQKTFGFASQNPSFYEHLSVKENLMLYGELYGISKKKVKSAIPNLLKLVGLEDEEETIAGDLSGGMQRRLDIACSIIHEPKVLFMDEPTSDLDPIMRRHIWKLIKDINSRGTTVVLTSHILEEVENLCIKVGILHNKGVLGHGKLSELKKLFRKGQQIRIELDPPNYDALLKKVKKRNLTVDRISEQADQIVIFCPRNDKNTEKILNLVRDAKEKLVKIDISDANLTEIFEALARKKN